MTNFTHPHPDCADCNRYLARRGEVLPQHIVAAARRRRMDPKALLVEFVHGVHGRHMAGLSIEVPS